MLTTNQRLRRQIAGLLLATVLVAGGCAGAGRSHQLCYTCDPETCIVSPVDACEVSAGASVDPRPSVGEIDLTGDGIPERVFRQGSAVTIEQDGAVVWQTEGTWRVVDMALGDPNDDGRGELLLAFWRDDGEGVARSHPFIIGYRGGIYRTLWGGSAVREPIDELELGDVDGDGAEELIVLETTGDTARTVSVWHWHGWGFSLRWRSAPGDYADLVVLPNPSGGAAKVSVTRVP